MITRADFTQITDRDARRYILLPDSNVIRELPLNDSKLKNPMPKVRRSYESLNEADGAVSNTDAKFRQRNLDISFLFNLNLYGPVVDTYQEFANFIYWALLEQGPVYLCDSGLERSGELSEIPRRTLVEFENATMPDLAEGSRIAEIKLDFMQPRALWEDLQEKVWPQRGEWQVVNDQDVIEVGLTRPDGTPFPVRETHCRIEIQSDSTIRRIAIQRFYEGGADPGQGQQFSMALTDYFPGQVIEIDGQSKVPNGRILLRNASDPPGKGAAKETAIDADSGYLRLYAGANRFKVYSPDGPLRMRISYRRGLVR